MCIKFEGAFYERQRLQKKNKNKEKKKAQKKSDAYGDDSAAASVVWHYVYPRMLCDRKDSPNIF